MAITVDKGERTILSSLTLTVLLLGTLLTASVPCTAEPPRITVGLDLEQYSIEIMSSPTKDTSGVIAGSVTISSKVPGESVSVQFSYYGAGELYALPEPGSFIFTDLGTQYFNVTIFLKEDTPPGGDYRITIGVTASSRNSASTCDQQVTVYPTWEVMAEATVLKAPPAVEPGGTTVGKVEVRNTGSRYVVCDLILQGDPDGVVKEVALLSSIGVTPNIWDKAEFSIEVGPNAPVGVHTVVLGVVTQMDDGTVLLLDVVTIEVEIEEATGFDPVGPIIVLVGGLVILGVAAYLFRRKA